MSRQKNTRKTGPTLDGEPATLAIPRTGRATVCTPAGRRLMVDREEAYRITREEGSAFVSPPFARPRATKGQA